MESDVSTKTLSEVYGFLGNSLLKPMSQTLSVGLDVAFWAAFPDFGDDGVRGALAACAHYAADVASQPETEAVERVSVEYTRLFVGPPSPAAPPWETLHCAEGASAGFGKATFEMRQLLREAGLELSNENRQYEDHMGIELLYLSEMCRRACADEDGVEDALGDAQIATFIRQHPLHWIDALQGSVQEAFPGGYFNNLLALTRAVLVLHVRLLEELS